MEPETVALPNINQSNSRQSPFKHFLDISIVQQKLRKTIDGHNRGMSYDNAFPRESNRHTQNQTAMDVHPDQKTRLDAI